MNKQNNESSNKSSSFSNIAQEATLFFLGLTGSGISSTINFLFNDQILTENNTNGLIKQSIMEYKLNFEIQENGFSNGTLKIVDTPGFGNTSDIDLDSKILSCLGKYIDENKENITCCYIIVARFDDKHFKRENSLFKKMLKSVDSLISCNKSAKKHKVVFILTHFMNAKIKDRINPENKIEDFKRIIIQFKNFSDPILCVGENEPEEHGLFKNPNHGFYDLPNFDLYPRNILIGIQEAFYQNDEDIIGEEIIRMIFKNCQNCTKNINRIELDFNKEEIMETSVLNLDNILLQLSNGNIKEEIKILLTQAQCKNKLTDDVKRVYLSMARTFERKGIERFLDLKEFSNIQMQTLIKDLPRHKLVREFLEFSCGLSPPKLEIKLQTGYGFRILDESFTSTSIFEQPVDYPCDLGFFIPAYLKYEQHNVQLNNHQFLDKDEDYVKLRMRDFGISTSINCTDFSFGGNYERNKAYNIGSKKKTFQFSAISEFRLFSLSIDEKYNLKLTQEFQNDVNNLPKFNPKNPASVEIFECFFNRHGTHVVISSFGGGQLEILAQYKGKNGFFNKTKFHHFKSGFTSSLNIFNIQTNYNNVPMENQNKFRQNFNYKLNAFGGNTLDLNLPIDVSQTDSTRNDLLKWKESLNEKPMMLQNKLKLTSIIYYADKVNSKSANELKLAANHIFKAKLPSSSPSPRRRNEISPIKRLAVTSLLHTLSLALS